MARYSILIVDDEPDLRDLVQICLEAAGHQVAVAADGLKASGILLREQFDLMVTDVLMPDRDGIELIGEAKTKYPAMRIVVMTAGGADPAGRLPPDREAPGRPCAPRQAFHRPAAP